MNFRDKLCAMSCHRRFYELEDFFQSVHKLDMHYMELWNGPVHYYVDARRHDSPEQLKKLCDHYRIAITNIRPERTNPKLNNIAVKQKHRQEEVLNYYRRVIDIAYELECRQVLVTSGWRYYNRVVEEVWSRSVVMMKRVTGHTKQRDVILALEALQSEELRPVNTVQDIRRYRNEIGNSRLKVCIDFGTVAHMRHTPRECSRAFGSNIVHIHFVDGNPADRLAWGSGSRDLKVDLTVLEEYGYPGYLSLETATQRYYEKP